MQREMASNSMYLSFRERERELKKMSAALNPILIKETLNKMDQCMARLQELQYTVAGGKKVVLVVNLSPHCTRGYLRTGLSCKQESPCLVLML